MKKVKYLLLIAIVVLAVGCFKKDKTYEYKSTNTGETIKVSASKDYTLTESEPIKVTKGNDEIASIIFITKENYEEVKKLFDDGTLKPIEQGKKDKNEFYLYKVGEEYNIVIGIDGANTSAAITTKSEEVTKTIADDIKFSK